MHQLPSFRHAIANDQLLVLDSNVLLAALLTKGLTSDVFEYCCDYHEIYLSGWIINEVAGKLREKFEIPEAKLEESINFIKREAKVINPDGEPPGVCRDKDDNNILHVGSFIEADYIITGDKDLLVLSNYDGVRIINPRDFWIKIKQQES